MQVLNLVADRIPEIVRMGVPIPEHIPFNLDNVIPDHTRMQKGQVPMSKLHHSLPSSVPVLQKCRLQAPRMN